MRRPLVWFVHIVGRTRARRKARREKEIYFFRTRKSGGGGPPEVRGANAGWWRGLLTRRFVFVERVFVAARAPSPTLLRKVVPLPRYRGGG